MLPYFLDIENKENILTTELSLKILKVMKIQFTFTNVVTAICICFIIVIKSNSNSTCGKVESHINPLLLHITYTILLANVL